MLDPRGRLIVGLNRAGGALLDELAQARSLADLVGGSAGSAQGKAADDLQRFLEALVGLGLIERAAVATGSNLERPAFAELATTPELLWQEAMVEVVLQTSPPQAITNPQCHP